MNKSYRTSDDCPPPEGEFETIVELPESTPADQVLPPPRREDPVIQDIPPHDEAAEVGVLGSMLMDYRAAEIAIQELNVEDFYLPRHKTLFVALIDLYATGANLDELYVVSELTRQGKLEICGGQDAIARLITDTPSAANVEAYCKVVKDRAVERGIIEAGAQMIQAARHPQAKGAAELIQESEVLLEQVRQQLPPKAPDANAAAKVQNQIQEEIAGTRKTIPLPWPVVSRATLAIKPGTVIGICGQVGSGKSSLAMQLCVYWDFECNVSVALYEMEDGQTYHVRRALAQKIGDVRIAADDNHSRNPEFSALVTQASYDHADFMNRVGSWVYAASTGGKTLAQLSLWIQQQAANGKRIIVIDPITAAKKGPKSWIEEEAFLTDVKMAIEKYQCSLVIITHPKQTNKKSALADIAGGACWERFCQTVLWLSNPGPDKEIAVTRFGVTENIEYNRVMAILKARNSYGEGLRFAMKLEHLKLTELGVVKV